MPHFDFADWDKIQDFEDVSDAFIRGILDLDPDKTFISNESRLSDFSGCGLSDFDSETLEDFYNPWDEWVITEIEHTYGFKLTSTNILLVDLFTKIQSLDS